MTAHEDADAVRAIAIAEKCAPLLAKQGSHVQGMVIATLAATWVCGHRPVELRDGLIDAFTAGLRAMVANMSKEKKHADRN